MRIVPLDPAAATDADVEGLHRVLAAAAAVDRPDDPPPVLEDVAARLHNRREDTRRLRWVARTGDGIAGYAVLHLSLLDNTHMGYLQLTVHPDHRRQGTGTALLRAAVGALVAEGRRVLLAETDRGTAGDEFSAAMGVRLVQTDRMSLLRLADVDWAGVAEAAAAKHPGYRLEAWVERCPDELVDGYARAKAAMNDAPRDDADLTEFLYTAETIRADEESARSLGQVRVVVAVHEASGDVAGFTEVLVARRPHRSFQADTAVLPAHRGCGLGLWVKADMLVRLRTERPDVAELLTGNSTTNRHMLAINERLGFRPWSQVHGWQGDVPALATRLG